MPLAAAITTNYDALLEHMGVLWAGNVLTLANDRHLRAAELGQFFVLKLFGDLAATTPVSLCRSEFEGAVAGCPTVAATFERLFRTRTMFFVGCSLEGLLADLKTLGVKKTIGRRHFALAAVSSSSWKSRAAQLSDRYGIQVLACAADTVSSALPDFLNKLAAEVDKMTAQQREIPSAIEHVTQ